MHKLVSGLFFTIVLLVNTSCFEIIEEINLKKDGSGTARLKIDLSQSKDNLAGYMEMDEVKGMKIPSKAEIMAELENVRKILEGVEGISNVKTDLDLETFVLNLTGDFRKIEDINTAINTAARKLNKSNRPVIEEDNYLYDGNVFYRLFNYPVDDKVFDKLGTMERFMLESAKLVSIFRFDNNILDYSNRNAQLSPNLTAILFESSIADLIKGTKTIENTIELEN